MEPEDLDTQELNKMKKVLPIVLLSLSSLLCFSNEINQTYETQRKFDHFFLEAVRLKEKGEHTNAFNMLQYALKIDSTSAAALFELSHYYLFLRQDSLALDVLQKSVKYSPKNHEYKILLADLSRKMRKFDESIDLYEELAKEFPSKPEIHFYLSELYLQLRQNDKAIQSLDNLEGNMGVSEPISLQKFQLYNLIGEKEKAVLEIKKLSDKFPMEAKYPIILGDFYLSQKEEDKALEQYKIAHKLNPNNPYYFISMAGYYEYKGNDEAVIKEIDKALRNPLLDIETKLSILGKYIQDLHITKKDFESANTLLETLIEQHSQEKELNLMYGEFLLSQEKLEDAKFQFQIVTETDPENIIAWRKLLNIALRENNLEEIISICDNALLYFTDASEFYFYKGSAYYQKKEYTQAIEIFSEGLKLVPENNRALKSNFYGQIGDLHYQLGDKEKAYQTYEKALEIDENNLLILNNYAYFLSLDKRELDKAERMSAKCMRIEANNITYIDTYAWIFFQKENYSLAKFYIESALSKGGRMNGEILEHYGDILFMTGNIDKAVEEWEKALLLKEQEEENTDILKKKITDRTYYEH